MYRCDTFERGGESKILSNAHMEAS
jgi:hypothetical protein